MNNFDRNAIRQRKHRRVRKHLSGTLERPRLCVFRSNSHIYAQLIDDVNGKTIAAASSLDPAIRGEVSGCNVQSAAAVGKLIAERALEKGVDTVVFDRGGYIFHGRVASLANAAREAGLKF